MRPTSSVALAFIASIANHLILAAASPLLERQQDDTISVRTRVSLHPAQVDILEDADYALWSVDEESSSSFSTNSLNFTLSTGDEAVALQGDWNKFVYRKTLPSLGERLVGTGISTDEDSDGGAVTLTIVGLPEGEHSLLTWHNSFVKGDEFAQVSISVDGSEAASDISQSSEVNNIWDAATSYIIFATGGSGTVEITFTPSGADNRVYLNGFEIDGPDIGYQVGFPEPENKHEHVEVEGGSITASWRTPRDTESATYDIYLGTDPDSLESVASGVSETQVELSGLNTHDTFYWRVDVTTDGKHYPGRAFMFRLAQLAFPGAEGYGRFARGGRGGKVVHVTTLEDGEQEGTLRWALTGVTGPRTVVFDVGGVITTTSRLSVNSPYVTVAGQTAPGKGIAVQGHPLGLTGAQDVVFRHVRVRPGTISGETIDGMGMQGSNYCIFDRCSMGWAIDECFSSRSAHNITFQRSMISEPLNVAGHQNYPEGTAHGYSATIGGDIGSFHHNLLAHAEGRSWSMGGGADDNGAFAGQLDIRNNVVYNFGTRVTDGGAHKVDFVGNYYKPGPSSERTFALEATYEDGLPGTQQYHCAGNSMLGIFDQESEQYPPGDGTSQSENIACYAKVSIDPPPDYQAFFDEPFFESYVETQTSTEAYKRVLSDSGASQPILDDHDRRIIQETLNGTTTYTGSKSGKEGLIDSPDDAGGLEDFPTVTRSASWDADDDGIADWWDGSTGGEGYTALDGYLNFMAEPHAFVEPSGSVTVNLAALAAGFESPSFALSEASLGSVSVDGSEATFKASGEAGVDRLEITIKDGEGTWTRPFGVAVFEGADDAQ